MSCSALTTTSAPGKKPSTHLTFSTVNATHGCGGNVVDVDRGVVDVGGSDVGGGVVDVGGTVVGVLVAVVVNGGDVVEVVAAGSVVEVDSVERGAPPDAAPAVSSNAAAAQPTSTIRPRRRQI